MPIMIALRRSSFGSPAAARPMTTALSPASTRSIMMTCISEVMNAASNIGELSPARAPGEIGGPVARCQPMAVTSRPNSQSKRPAISRGATAEAGPSPSCAGPRSPGRRW